MCRIGSLIMYTFKEYCQRMYVTFNILQKIYPLFCCKRALGRFEKPILSEQKTLNRPLHCCSHPKQ